MALRISTALRSAIQDTAAFKYLMSNCVLKIYTGAQPATADAAATGTLLATFSASSGALTREVLATGLLTLTGGGSGSVDTFTVDGREIMGSATSFNTSLIQTATDIVTKINNNPKNQLWVASNVAGTSAAITLTARPGLGTLYNSATIARTSTTITTSINGGSSSTIGGSGATAGVDAVNGLNWGDSALGIVVKLSTQTWSSTPVATGTAGYFRLEAAVTDDGLADSTYVKYRVDGAIATSGAELNMGNTTITTGVPLAFDSFSITFPTD